MMNTARLAPLLLSLLALVPATAADYVAVPGGSFMSVLSGGSAQNLPVPVTAFSMRKTVVTNGEFTAFTAAHPEWQRSQVPPVFADASYLHQYEGSAPASLAAEPVTSVSWFAAEAYCENEGARLPTWYEWEYVAAADATRRDARKDPAWRARILNWYAQSSSTPRPVVGAATNAYGISDLHGLVWEWVDDFNALLVSADSRNQGDPDQLQFCGAGAISLQDRENYAVLMRVALLSSLGGADTTNNLGFRCVRSQPLEHSK
jgi:sulfatase modifying factor 1